MKIITQVFLTAGLTLLLGFQPASKSSFEGTFTYVIERQVPDQVEKSKTVESIMEFYIKGDQTLIENKRKDADYNFKFLIKDNSENFYILMNRNGRKLAMKQTINSVNNTSDKNSQKVDFTKTEKTKTIKGYHCRLYKIRQSDYTGEAWITKELDLDNKLRSAFNIMQRHPQNTRSNNTASASNYPDNGVVMQSTMNAKDSDHTVHMELESISEKEVSADLFDISGYRVMDIGGSGSSFGK